MTAAGTGIGAGRGFGPGRTAAEETRSDWLALGLYGIRYRDAMRSAADARRELERRLARVDAFLAISEEEYNRVPADRHSCPARETLREIREWFKGELAIACRALGLPAAEVGEKEAAYEFDCGYPRRQASIMALRDFLEACGRYDGKTREMVEGGAVLDISRRFLDETAMLRVAGLDMSTLRYTRPE